MSPIQAKNIMEFPYEILNMIVSRGLDCCKTSISWSKISPAFKDIITENLGVIVILDGFASEQNMHLPMEYRSLMSDKNSLLMLTDHPEDESLALFLPNYLNLLVVVQSNRSYSDVLASLFYEIAQKCLQGTNISVVYTSSLNFLSKLYFRELALYQDQINLCELHVIGNSSGDDDEMCDINTLFERTFTYNLESVYSLDVQSPSHKLISSDLHVIKLLNFMQYNEAMSSFFTQCPNLRVIESTKFPTFTENANGTFRLPRCDFINLTNYVDGSHYPRIDGTDVHECLTLTPSLRSHDLEFTKLSFPSIKRLVLKLNDVSDHLIRFRDCDFRSIDSLECGSCVVPWCDFTEANGELKSLKLTLLSLAQLEWLKFCPASVQKLIVEAPKSRIVNIPVSPVFEDVQLRQLRFRSIEIEVDHLWQCYLLQKVILSPLEYMTDLKVVLDEDSLFESITLNRAQMSELGLEKEDDYIIFKVPYVRHFTLFGKDNFKRDRPLKSQKSDGNSVSHQILSPAGYANMFYDSDASKDSTYAVSPSAFRRNSLAGADSQTARRQSAIVFSGSPADRRHSSFGATNFASAFPANPQEDTPFDSESVVFTLSEDCPDIITTNIFALESSLLSSGERKLRRVPLLQVKIEDVSLVGKWQSLNQLVPLLVPRIIEVLKYPYDVRLPNMIVEKFQVLVDCSQIVVEDADYSLSKVSLELENFLSCKGQKLRVVTNPSDLDFKVSVLLHF